MIRGLLDGSWAGLNNRSAAAVNREGEPCMRQLRVKRRRFLATASMGGIALSLGRATAAAAPQDQAMPGLSPQFLGQLAQYANLPLPPDRAAQLVPLLAGPLATLRGTRPAEYDDLEPAASFHVPPLVQGKD